MHKDVLGAAKRSVLSKKKSEGKMGPEKYESRVMNTAESRYLAFEREALAVVFGIMKSISFPETLLSLFTTTVPCKMRSIERKYKEDCPAGSTSWRNRIL